MKIMDSTYHKDYNKQIYVEYTLWKLLKSVSLLYRVIGYSFDDFIKNHTIQTIRITTLYNKTERCIYT